MLYLRGQPPRTRTECEACALYSPFRRGIHAHTPAHRCTDAAPFPDGITRQPAHIGRAGVLLGRLVPMANNRSSATPAYTCANSHYSHYPVAIHRTPRSGTSRYNPSMLCALCCTAHLAGLSKRRECDLDEHQWHLRTAKNILHCADWYR